MALRPLSALLPDLDAPTDLEVVDQTDSSVTLEWKNSKAAVESYQVKHSTLSGTEHGVTHFLPSAGDITLATITGEDQTRGVGGLGGRKSTNFL